MNHVLQLLKDYRSDRSFTNKPVDDTMLAEIVDAAQRAPSSANAQHNSIIIVKDANTKAKIAQLTGGQSWIAQAPVFIAIVVDFYKTSVALETVEETQVIHQHIEGTIAASTDAGIILATILTAARSLGLGTVPIGGVRAGAALMGELLDLPRKALVLVGVALGHIDNHAEIKPRLPVDTFCHDERYDPSAIHRAVNAYNDTLQAHWDRIGRTDGQSWSRNLAGYYNNNYRPSLKIDMLNAGIETS